MHIGGGRFLQDLRPRTEARDRRAVGQQQAFAGEQPAHDLTGQGQAGRAALAGGLGADVRIGDVPDIVVLHVLLADAAQFAHDRHADLPQMLGVADTRRKS